MHRELVREQRGQYGVLDHQDAQTHRYPDDEAECSGRTGEHEGRKDPCGRQSRPQHHESAAVTRLGRPCHHGKHSDRYEGSGHQGQERRIRAAPQHRRGIAGQEAGDQVGGVADEGGRCADQDGAPVSAQHLRDRTTGRGTGSQQRRELLSLVHPEPHPQSDGDEDDRPQEGQPPAPGQERLLRHHLREQDRQRGTEQPDRGAVLREGPVERTSARGSMLDREEHRATPLPTDRESLGTPEEHEQHRRPHPDLGVGRQETDADGRAPHQQQREHQRVSAADAVTEVREHRRPHRTDQETYAEGGERQERARQRIGGREEQWAEDEHHAGAVDEEVVPLDGRADHGGDCHTSRTQRSWPVLDHLHHGIPFEAGRTAPSILSRRPGLRHPFAAMSGRSGTTAFAPEPRQFGGTPPVPGLVSGAWCSMGGRASRQPSAHC